MNLKLFSFTLLMGLIFGASCSKSFADTHENHPNHQTSIQSLSPELRTLLKKEMLALQEGMKLLISEYISGNLTQVAKIAAQMQHSYILKQSLTEQQTHELMNKLPQSFLTLDQKFHQYAGMLQHVSQEKNLELVGFYYSKLSETCVSCHSEYAKHRFPEFNLKSSNQEHHH